VQVMNDRSKHSIGLTEAKLGELAPTQLPGGGEEGWRPPSRWLITGVEVVKTFDKLASSLLAL
jgi:hypothetical protein